MGRYDKTKGVAIAGGRFLVTGGAGFIGSHITDQLLGAGAKEVVCLDNLTRGTPENLREALETGRARLVEADVRDEGAVLAAAKGMDGIFHQAALRVTACAEKPVEAVEVMAGGTVRVLEAARRCGVRKVVAASSASIYGMADRFPTDESHPPYNDETLYGALKCCNEGMLRAYRAMHGLDFVALRYFNVYGPRMDLHGVYTEVLVRWMDRIDAGEPVVVHGDGTQTMDFVYVEDVARANLLAMESNVTGCAFNVASGTETSLSELLEALAAAMGASPIVRYEPERKVNPVRRRLGATDAAREALGFSAEVGLAEGLRRLVAWRRAASTQANASRASHAAEKRA